jgi:hypothetical protein
MMFLNAGFTGMVKNWICNIKTLDAQILQSVLFVATDDQPATELREFHSGLQIFVTPSNWTMSVSFGSFAYYSVVLERMLIQNILIQAGISVQIIEADQIWQTDVTPTLRNMLRECDILVVTEGPHVASDGSLGVKMCGGFYGIRAKKSMRNFFQDYITTYADKLAKFDHATEPLYLLPNFMDDQDYLTEMLARSVVDVLYVPKCFYVPGLWYEDEQMRGKCQRPSIIHNNYIIGTKKKIARAVKENHWFLAYSHGEQVCSHSGFFNASRLL